MKRELAARVAEAASLEEKFRGMGVRMGVFLGVKEEVDQARADINLWAARQRQGFGEEIVLEQPLPAELEYVLRPVYECHKHSDRDGSPFWVLKRTRDDKSLARLR